VSFKVCQYNLFEIANFLGRSRDKLNTDVNKSSIKRYQNNIKKSDLEFEIYLKKLGIAFVKIYTHDNPIHKLKQLFI